jgi:hypothetical protein
MTNRPYGASVEGDKNSLDPNPPLTAAAERSLAAPMNVGSACGKAGADEFPPVAAPTSKLLPTQFSTHADLHRRQC